MKFTKQSGSILSILFCGVFTGLVLCLNAFAGDIAVFGDSQVDAAVQRKVIQAVLSFKPSIVFRLGDNVNDGNDPAQWKLFNDINGPLLKTAEYFPVLGNHEEGSPLYFANFPFLNHRRWYSVEREGIHFVVLDSNSSLGPGSEQYNWLNSDLASVKDNIKFKIVLCHHPLFSVGPHIDDEKGIRAVLLPIFEKYRVCAAFSGHNHNYQHFQYQGIDFVVAGGGGSQLTDQDKASPYLKKFLKAYHFCLLSAGNGFLRVRVMDVNLNIIDDFKVPPR